MAGTIYQNGQYLEKNPYWHVEESPWKAEQVLCMLKRHDLRVETICEVGCGAGEVLKQLHTSLDGSCTFWGYEVSPQAFELCQSRASERLQFKLADITQEEDAFFDLILVLDVIEHLEDYFSFLRGIKARSTYKIFHIPLDLSMQTILRRGALLKRRDMYSHLHYFTKETALRTLTDVGYEVHDYFYTPRSIKFGVEPIQKFLRLPRRLGFAVRQDLTARILGGFSLLVLAR